jgi:lipoprotein signal peptidase
MTGESDARAPGGGARSSAGPSRATRFACALFVVLGLDVLAKLAAIGHLTPAGARIVPLEARRRALRALDPRRVAVRAWAARHPCARQGAACPRQWMIAEVAALRYVENAGAAGESPRTRPSATRRAGLVLASLAALALAGAGGLRYPWAAGRLGAVAGGVLGNLLDRIRLGYVVDYLELHALGEVGPVVNLADVLITLGFAAFLAGALRRGAGRAPG